MIHQKKWLCGALALVLFGTGGILVGLTSGDTASAKTARNYISPAAYVDVATATTEVATATTRISVPLEEDGESGGSWISTDTGRMFYYDDGTFATGAVNIGGVPYLFDESGIQKTGWRTIDGVRRYYDPETGECLVGWLESSDGTWYYVDGDDGKIIGAATIDGIDYNFDDYGTQETGWVTFDDSHHYYDEDGTAATGVTKIGKYDYLFDSYGVERTGWRTVNGVRRYYDPETGECINGWVEDGGYRYYVSSTTGKTTGELKLGGIRYALDDEYGYQYIGFYTFSDGETHYYDDDGSPHLGWLSKGSLRYYFNENYKMVTGWSTIDDSRYHFTDDGVMNTGWQDISENRYYFGDDGVMRTDWQTISGKKYYFGTTGAMKTGFCTIDGDKYYFGDDGAMRTGWQTVDGEKYYLGSDGIARTYWQTLDGKTYYFGGNGVMRTGFRTLVADGNTYYFGTTGYMHTGWQTVDGKKYYFGSNGVMRTGWQTLDGATYYFSSNGEMLTGWADIKDAYYYLGTNGKLVTFTYGNNNLSLAYYALNHVGDPYWYGTYGQTADAKLLSKKSQEYPMYYTDTDFATQYGEQVFDCSGLIKGFLWSSSVTGSPVYTASQDISAKDMYATATKHGTISSFPYHVGMLVFKGDSASSIHHVGVYIGHDLVVEAKGHEYGVIISQFSTDSNWTYWAQSPWITDDGYVDKP